MANHCYFLYGMDGYRVHEGLKAIEARFLSQVDSQSSLVRYDMTETPLATLEGELLAIPFLVSHRLFILSRVFDSPKATQEGIIKQLEHLSPSTLVVIYEPGNVDKRTVLYKWLIAHAKSQEFAVPAAPQLAAWINKLAGEQGANFNPEARALIASYYSTNTWQLAHEVKKLACYARSQERTEVTGQDVALLCDQATPISVFALTNAIRDNKLAVALSTAKQLQERDDPLAIAGLVGAHVRTLVKIVAGRQMGITSERELAQKTKLNPYVITLARPSARDLTLVDLSRGYDTLIRFDTDVKTGRSESALALTLLIIRLITVLGAPATQRA